MENKVDWGRGKNWYEDECFKPFWNNYQELFQTNKKFRSYYEYFNAMKQASYAAHILATKTMEESLPNKNTILNDNKNELQLDISQLNADQKHREIKEGDEVVEFEINDDYLKFYEESLKYKKEKKATEKKKLKQMEDEGISVEHVSGEQVNLNVQMSSKRAPLTRAGFEREEELKILYGSASNRIHRAETRIQMKYSKNLDLHQPIYWPSFPLKMKFD